MLGKSFQQEEQKSLNLSEKKFSSSNKDIEEEIQIQKNLDQQYQNDQDQCISTDFMIICISFSHGLIAFTQVPLFMYQKQILKLEPQTIQLLTGLIALPWCIKPLFGYLLDKFVNTFGKTKYMVVICATWRILAYFLVAFYSLNIYSFFFIFLTVSISLLLENIICEYILVLQTKERNKYLVKKTENQLPIYFGWRACGTLLGNFFGGRALKFYSIQKCFLIMTFSPFLLLLIICLYSEKSKKADESEKKSFKKEIQILKELITRKEVFYFILFIFFINITPSFDMLITFYLTDYLKFTTEDLADFSTFATLCYILGLLLYYFYFKKSNPISFYKGTLIIYWFSNFLFLVVIFDLANYLNLSNKFFCMFTQGVAALIGELNFMPLLGVWSNICPPNLEATSITLFTGFINTSNNISNYLGAFLIWFLGIHKQDYDKIWILIIIQNSYLIIVIVALFFIEFPNLNSLEAEEKNISILNDSRLFDRFPKEEANISFHTTI